MYVHRHTTTGRRDDRFVQHKTKTLHFRKFLLYSQRLSEPFVFAPGQKLPARARDSLLVRDNVMRRRGLGQTLFKLGLRFPSPRGGG